jgi:hypothetical protein
MWLIPLVWGWFSVGTHHGRRKDVAKILHESSRNIILPNGKYHDQVGKSFDHERDNAIGFPGGDDSTPPRQRALISLIRGRDESLDGPFYNYARSRTWFNLAESIIEIYENNLSERPLTSTTVFSQITTIPFSEISFQDAIGIQDDASQESGVPMTSTAIRKRPSSPSTHYFSWSRNLLPFAMAFGLQGIFSGSALIIVYMTPTIGFGCRSLICLTNFLASTFACVFLILASYLSDSHSLAWEQFRGIRRDVATLT